MMQHFYSWILYKHFGWKKEITENLPEKCIICLAPHTSNMDFIVGQLFAKAEGMKTNFLMKKEWFFWPLGPIFKRWGGIPVFRKKHSSMTEALTHTARNASHFVLCITPEGTRSMTAEWKKGFYYIAQGADVPILLGYLDYSKKVVGVEKIFIPTGDLDTDMDEIKKFYLQFKGRYPENFAI